MLHPWLSPGALAAARGTSRGRIQRQLRDGAWPTLTVAPGVVRIPPDAATLGCARVPTHEVDLDQLAAWLDVPAATAADWAARVALTLPATPASLLAVLGLQLGGDRRVGGRYLLPVEAAARLGINRRTLYRRVELGLVPCLHLVGRLRRIEARAVDAAAPDPWPLTNPVDVSELAALWRCQPPTVRAFMGGAGPYLRAEVLCRVSDATTGPDL